MHENLSIMTLSFHVMVKHSLKLAKMFEHFVGTRRYRVYFLGIMFLETINFTHFTSNNNNLRYQKKLKEK